MTYKVLFVNPLNDYIDRLVEATPEGFAVAVMPPETDVSRLCQEAADADFIISGVEVPEEVFRAAPNVQFIQYMSSGYGQLPLETLNDLGVPVAQMKTHSISVAEHALTLMLTVLRRIPASTQLLREGKWRQDLDETSYSELYGKTVGIVGLGNIGRWVGRIVRHGFGANVIFYDDAEIPLTVSELLDARAVPLDELMENSDVVCVNLPLNDRSGQLIGETELGLMKSSAVLVNVGRGEVIDESALIRALQEGRIAGAGLDVYDREPLDLKSPLLDLEQVVCTPHMAGVGWENVQRRIATVWENIQAVAQGETPRGVVTTNARVLEEAS
ncbi:NAD(P)-dependent oxidoreductase [Zhihengliuella flava]|uniref:Phosphoglycerate dehydrogenase-like enzyme n=1 Tax=Zhihengliuella flava TaxID=1285193 RepID=A0A931GJ01_9MICC|nr:NAD(P)-dependent oxidoreductase [Zhihengliuella flava]MBG6084801.1 phosphoglycerate dehydrogenase-like enzyme [Zhihengliuella flava]